MNTSNEHKRGLAFPFGQDCEATVREVLPWLEAAVCEGLLTGAERLSPVVDHLFGRVPAVHFSTDLSFLAGLAATGLRTAAFLPKESLEQNRSRLAALARQHVPAVVHLSIEERDGVCPPGHDSYHALNHTGVFQVFVADLQAAVDWTLIAHAVAERALLPGVVATDGVLAAGSRQAVSLPDRAVVRRLLGDPDEWVESYTPAQQLIFGRRRRRVPNWYNFDFPAQFGLAKPPAALRDEAAAQGQFFEAHLPEIMDAVLAEYASLTGRSCETVAAHQADRADYVILSQGAASGVVRAAAQRLRAEGKGKVGSLDLQVLRPFPADRLRTLLAGKKTVTVLENQPVAGPGPLEKELRAVLATLGKKSPQILGGAYAAELTEENAVAAFRNMMRGGEGKQHYLLGVTFVKKDSAFPRHEVLLQAVNREYPALSNLSLQEEQKKAIAARPPLLASPPRAIRRYRDRGAPYTQLSRFYHDTAAFYGGGPADERIADPFQALPLAPAASAGLLDMGSRAEQLPVFQPEHCTGCGQCMVYCPHAALPSLAIGMEELLRAGMGMAAGEGKPVTQLTPLVKNLAKVAAQVIRASATPVGRVADFLPAAFEKLLKQLSPPEEKATSLREGFEVVSGLLADFPVAVTDTFFNDPETLEKGSGSLFSLAIDPHACTGCGRCAAVCEEEALRMEPATATQRETLSHGFALWEALPDTSSELIHRLVHDRGYDSAAAILLSRNFYLSMTGASATEQAAPGKSLLHLVTAVAESVTQPAVSQQVRRIDELYGILSKQVHDSLSEALPRDRYDGLLQALEQAPGGKLPVDEIVGKLGEQERLQLIDTSELKRKVALVNNLKELRWVLVEGPTGAGRARFGLTLLTDSWPWAREFPFNPFIVPAFYHGADFSAEWVLGMYRGHLRHLLDNLKLLRRAQLEAKKEYHPQEHDRVIAGLNWEDLTEEEKNLAPPLLLVGDERLLSRTGELQELLAGKWPVKVIIMEDAAPSPEADAGVYFSRRQSLLLGAMHLRQPFVFQGILDDSSQWFDALLRGLHTRLPALFHFYAPDPLRQAEAAIDWRSLSALARSSRAFPTLTFDPERLEGEALSSALSLEGNPGEAAAAEGYAGWLFTHQDWQPYFQPVTEGSDAMVPLASYLTLDEGGRAGKMPVIHPEGQEMPWQVSTQVVAAARAAGRHWLTWREVSGTLTRFPEKLRAEVEKELTEKYEQTLDGLRAEYEQKLQQQEQELMQSIKVKLRERLLALSQRGTQ